MIYLSFNLRFNSIELRLKPQSTYFHCLAGDQRGRRRRFLLRHRIGHFRRLHQQGQERRVHLREQGQLRRTGVDVQRAQGGHRYRPERRHGLGYGSQYVPSYRAQERLPEAQTLRETTGVGVVPEVVEPLRESENRRRAVQSRVRRRQHDIETRRASGLHVFR